MDAADRQCLREWAESHATVNLVQAKLALELLAEFAAVGLERDRAMLDASAARECLRKARHALIATGVIDSETVRDETIAARIADLYDMIPERTG